MSEQSMRQRVHQAIRALDPHAIENRCGIGTPDTTYTYGWIEMKCLKAWPVRPDTLVRLSHDLTKEQRVWLHRRWNAGGEAYMLLLVERTQDWLLFDGPTASRIIGEATQQQLRDAALEVWSRRELEEMVAPCLSLRANLRRESGSSLADVAAG